MESAKLRVAICGGGIGGVALANGLSKLSNITFDLYEAAPQIAASGLGVGLAQNAQRAMALLGPEVRATLDEAGAVATEPTVEIYMGPGKDFGKFIASIADSLPTLQVERGPFLEALAKQIDPRRLHTGKKLVSLEPHGFQHKIHFQDGSSVVADAVIGYDGIHSVVRRFVLGEDDPAVSPKFAHYFGYWTSVPTERARTVLGLNQIPNTQRSWVGKGTFLLYNLMGGGEKLMCAGVQPLEKPWDDNAWVQQLTHDEVDQNLAEWGEVGKQWATLFVDPQTDKATVISFWEHADASTYAKGSVCISGDAAHSMLPFLGAGAGQAIEDAMVLTKLLEHVKSRDDLIAAFAAYDHVRRPRTQAIVRSSNHMSYIMTSRDEEIKGDYEKLRALIPHITEDFINIDVEAHCKEAVEHMQSRS